MKQLAAILFVLFIIGCAEKPKIIPVPISTPQEVILKVVADNPVSVVESNKISRSMEVPNEEGHLSQLSFIAKDKAYIKIFSGLSVSDVTRVWNDVCVLEINKDINKIELFINSPGGDAFAGLALADELERARRKGFYITAHASGIIASAAVPVFAVCNRRLAAPGTIFMVHEAALWKWPGRETASDIRSQNELMELLESRYLDKLASHTKLSRHIWKEMETRTSWFDAEKAKKYGLVDEIE